MSDKCSHDCANCSEKCSERDFSVPLNSASRIGRVVAVASGKGGVGKSFVTSMLAVTAMRKGLRVGILDADITGPSVPTAFGIGQGAYKTQSGIEPSVSDGGIRIISLDMLLEDPAEPVVWRGPVIAGCVKQFWTDVHWGELDVLYVDMPPGTGDVPLTVFQSLPVDGVVIVSTPQKLVEKIVGKAVRMCSLMDMKILGLVENMSYTECPECGKRIEMFGPSRAEELAARFSLPAFARLAMNPSFAAAVDSGRVETLEMPELEAFA